MTFNELDYDALAALPEESRKEVMRRLFALGDSASIGFTRGRISPGANDYARSWYSCDEVAGDLELRHFNIDRDRQAIIPFIHDAQAFNPGLSFWISPWSPPSWMKINHDYPVLSSKYNNQSPDLDYLLYSGEGADSVSVDPDEMRLDDPAARGRLFPKRLATTDYFIQDPRYLSAYAEYFCRFIDEYGKEGIPVDIHGGSQPQVYIELFHLCANYLTDFLHQVGVPGLGQCPSDGNGGAVLVVVNSALRHILEGKEGSVKAFAAG
mgnify:CR=1 FL=1